MAVVQNKIDGSFRSVAQQLEQESRLLVEPLRSALKGAIDRLDRIERLDGRVTKAEQDAAHASAALSALRADIEALVRTTVAAVSEQLRAEMRTEVARVRGELAGARSELEAKIGEVVELMANPVGQL